MADLNCKKLIIHTDGGARGNPGPAGIGITLTPISPAVLRDEGEIQIAEYIGEATNNQAEYKAVIRAMEEARKLNASELEFYLDSELVVKQLNREYKVKNKELAPLFMKVYNLSQGFRKVTFKHVIRERNKEADALVNKAIDSRTVIDKKFNNNWS
ncbi:ribonuclease H [Candidatus Falkowbacteria bacterium CG10_big_fil_rev_8_21_14_0_10_44_15]|uniref:Ribonuclease H n=1 Tax=Candidatus Falkowbacteria bacterium CG10_big_fil_rev_8_21_14_0_10_44_15 TaxID=1974569 RepID=A0A2H0UZ04_9BACT|nr:MAG: ribonuclease H [Candidatus Falkowbacteria bacterium CG10_big_fil_rev_8_21_14_0_10_44_15]